MLRILFVDDEPDDLQAIRRTSQLMQHEWDMHFVDSGQAALVVLSQRPFDVVVSDMRMTRMDGADLLAAVRRQYPTCARIILSDCTEKDAQFRSTKVAHQLLSKPCRLDELTRTIDRIQASRGYVESNAIRAIVGQVDQLPVLGDVYEDFMAAVDRDTSTAEALGRIVSQDIALTAELLRLVNSAFFGLRRTVDSTADAITYLGVDVVRAIVAGHSVFGVDVPGLDVDRIACRAQWAAALVRAMLRAEGASNQEAAEGYLAGGLHEVGLLVLGSLPVPPGADLTAVVESNDPIVERLTFGADRFAIGAYLLGLWGFSPSLVEGVRSLGLDTAPEPSEVGRVGWALHVARRQLVLAGVDELDATVGEDALGALMIGASAELGAPLAHRQ